MKDKLDLHTLDKVKLTNKLPPIVLMAFTRYQFLEKVLSAIEKQTLQPPLILAFVDGPRNPEDKIAIEKTVHLLANFAEIIPTKFLVRTKNLGCDANIISSLNEVFSHHYSLVYLEDDVVPDPLFYDRMCRLLEVYSSEKTVFSVSAYASYEKKHECFIKDDFLISNRVFSLGLGMWKDRWEDIDLSSKPPGYNPFGKFYQIPATSQSKYTLINQFFLESKNQSDWVITMTVIALAKGYVHIIPKASFVRNIGFNHPDSKTGKGPEPRWLNEKYQQGVYLNTLPDSLELIQPLKTPISGIELAEHIEKQEGVWLNLESLIYFFKKNRCLQVRFYYLRIFFIRLPFYIREELRKRYK